MEYNIINCKQSAPSSRTAPVLIISGQVLKEIFKTIGHHRAETGGVLGGKGDAYQVFHYHFDRSSRNSTATYSPNHLRLNRLFKNDWNPRNIRFRGFVHSHPSWMSRPSHGDEIYAKRILNFNNDLECLLIPIVNTIPDTGKFKLTPWVAYRADCGVEIVKAKIKVVAESAEIAEDYETDTFLYGLLNKVLDEIVYCPPDEPEAPAGIGAANVQSEPADSRLSAVDSEDTDNQTSIPKPTPTDPGPGGDSRRNQTFDRVKNAYDLDIMRASRIICVGAGGAASFIEELARAGIEQFVLVDPDIVTLSNIATQQTYLRDIGQPKVSCIAERLRLINPAVKIIALQKKLDELSDEEIEHLATGAIDGCSPRRTVLCGLTDNFFPQARVNLLALHLGLPSLCAQVYHQGRGAEITFTYPGITPACHRCILSSRYRYFLHQHQSNPVTSHGTPIFTTTRLNAVKGFVLLALLHHGTNYPRWGGLLNRIGNRNLIQIRLDPDLTQSLGLSVFDRVFEKADKKRLLFDEAVWLPQEAECPETGYPNCPDCGGTGNLLDSIGKFEDTRIMRLSSDQSQEAKTTTHSEKQNAVSA